MSYIPELCVGDRVSVDVVRFDLGLLHRILAAVRLGVINALQEPTSFDDLHVIQIFIIIYN